MHTSLYSTPHLAQSSSTQDKHTHTHSQTEQTNSDTYRGPRLRQKLVLVRISRPYVPVAMAMCLVSFRGNDPLASPYYPFQPLPPSPPLRISTAFNYYWNEHAATSRLRDLQCQNFEKQMASRAFQNQCSKSSRGETGDRERRETGDRKKNRRQREKTRDGDDKKKQEKKNNYQSHFITSHTRVEEIKMQHLLFSKSVCVCVCECVSVCECLSDKVYMYYVH